MLEMSVERCENEGTIRINSQEKQRNWKIKHRRLKFNRSFYLKGGNPQKSWVKTENSRDWKRNAWKDRVEWHTV